MIRHANSATMTRRFAGGGLVNPLLLQSGGQDDTNPLLAQSLSALKPPGARRVEQRNPLLKRDQDIAMGNAVGELSNTERYQLDNPLNRPYKAGDVAPGSSAAASQLNQHTDIMSTLRDKLAEDPLYAGYADGGKVESVEELLARMQSKYKTGNTASEPAPQPAPVVKTVQPQPQPQGGIGGAFDALKNRQRQIDKAAGYANGGMIDGPGTSTSDSIPAKVKETGEPIGVSTDERIVSKPQNALLEIIAKGIGYDSLDTLLEDGTGKPVGPTIKAGKKGAATGKTPDDEDAKASMLPPGIRTGSDTAAANYGAGNPQRMSQFAQNGLTYDVQDTGQAGIKRVNAPGQNPLFTNIDPAQAVADMAKMKPGEVIFGPSGPGRGQRDPGWIDDGYGNDARPTIALKKELADLERDRYGRDLQSNITDPKAMALAQINLARMNAEDKQQSEMANSAIRAGIDQSRLGLEGRRMDLADKEALRAADKWSIEKPALQASAADSASARKARADLAEAIASGNPAQIQRARDMAVAAGVKLERPNNEFTATTDGLGLNVTRTNKDTGAVDIIDPKSGKIISIPAPGQAPARPSKAQYEAQIRAKNPGINAAQIEAGWKQFNGGK